MIQYIDTKSFTRAVKLFKNDIWSPSYWMQSFFVESSGSFLLDLNQSQENNCIASAIRFKSIQEGKVYIKVKTKEWIEQHL